MSFPDPTVQYYEPSTLTHTDAYLRRRLKQSFSLLTKLAAKGKDVSTDLEIIKVSLEKSNIRSCYPAFIKLADKKPNPCTTPKAKRDRIDKQKEERLRKLKLQNSNFLKELHLELLNSNLPKFTLLEGEDYKHKASEFLKKHVEELTPMFRALTSSDVYKSLDDNCLKRYRQQKENNLIEIFFDDSFDIFAEISNPVSEKIAFDEPAALTLVLERPSWPKDTNRSLIYTQSDKYVPVVLSQEIGSNETKVIWPVEKDENGLYEFNFSNIPLPELPESTSCPNGFLLYHTTFGECINIKNYYESYVPCKIYVKYLRRVRLKVIRLTEQSVQSRTSRSC